MDCLGYGSMNMHLSHLFDISPFLALSFCVCLGTTAWCIILLRRGCHHMADRFLIGFIGFLSVYQSIQILRRGGVFSLLHMQQLDEAVDLLVNSLYLLAALILRVSNQDRFEKIYRLRLAEAEIQAQPRLQEFSPNDRIDDPKVVERLRRAAPLLSPNALKLYLFICFQADFESGLVRASEDELLRFLANDRKALMSGFRELDEHGLCHVDQEKPKTPVQLVKDAGAPSVGPDSASAAG